MDAHALAQREKQKSHALRFAAALQLPLPVALLCPFAPCAHLAVSLSIQPLALRSRTHFSSRAFLLSRIAATTAPLPSPTAMPKSKRERKSA